MTKKILFCVKLFENYHDYLLKTQSLLSDIFVLIISISVSLFAVFRLNIDQYFIFDVGGILKAFFDASLL